MVRVVIWPDTVCQVSVTVSFGLNWARSVCRRWGTHRLTVHGGDDVAADQACRIGRDEKKFEKENVKKRREGVKKRSV